MRIRSRFASLAIAFALGAIAPAAHADTSQDAEALYQQGMDLLRDKKVDAACAALDRSEKLESRGGTLLSLAYCHEQQSKFSLAYSEYDEALRRLRVGGGRPDRESFATKQMESIRDKVVLVNVELAPSVNAPNPEIVVVPSKAGEIERKLVLGADRAKQVALDPDGGGYRIEVRAVDRKPFVAQVQVAGRTATPATVTVTGLATEGAAVGATGPAAPKPEDDGGSQRTLGLVIGGIGAALAIGGGVGGVLAIQCSNDVPSGKCERDKAMTVYANIANVGLGLGAVGLGIGGYLFFTAPKGTEKAAVTVTPSIGARSGGLSVGARF